jgi:hypothetical protein
MTLREALTALYERNGSLTAKSFVKEARDGKGPIARRLKEALPWDADQALYEHQLEVASTLIRKFRVHYKPTTRSELRSVRAFVSIPSPEGRSYRPIGEVSEDPMMSRLMLQDAEREWRQLKARFVHLQGFVEMVRRDLEADAA